MELKSNRVSISGQDESEFSFLEGLSATQDLVSHELDGNNIMIHLYLNNELIRILKHEVMCWFGTTQKQIQREGPGQVAYLGNNSSE